LLDGDQFRAIQRNAVAFLKSREGLGIHLISTDVDAGTLVTMPLPWMRWVSRMPSS
jgi:hypothetical protein